MKSKVFIKSVFFTLLLSGVLVLPGCKAWDWLKEKLGCSCSSCGSYEVDQAIKVDMGGLGAEVLASWEDGSSMVTQSDFDDRLEMLMREKPELKSISDAFLPVLKGQLLTSLVYEKIICRWIKDNKVSDRPEYKARIEQISHAVKNAIDAEFFTKAYQVSLTEEEKRDFYEKNKDRMSGVLISRGGVKATGVKFDKEADAKEFYRKVEAKSKDFDRLVKESKLVDKKRDFNLVNTQSSGIDNDLREKILDVDKVPKIEMIKASDSTFWVVNATEKQEPKYRSYELVEKDVERMVQQSKQGEVLQTELEKLKVAYGVKVKERAFMPKKVEQAAGGLGDQSDSVFAEAAKADQDDLSSRSDASNTKAPVTKVA